MVTQMKLLSPLRIFLFTALVATAATPAARAASLARFAGSGSGLILINQSTTVLEGNANPKVTASARAAKFVISCTINNVAAKQTITLRSGHASVDHLLPGINGFQASASGTYKIHGTTVRVTLPFSGGTMYMEIDTTTFGSILRISSQILLNGAQPIYSTIIAT